MKRLMLSRLLLAASLLIGSSIVIPATASPIPKDELESLSGNTDNSLAQLLNSTNVTTKLPTKYTIEDVPYTPMYEYWSTCAITSLEMQLKYFGADYPLPLLMNIDWVYGAVYVNTPDGPMLWPNTDPIPAILYTARTLGCRITEINNQDEKTAWETLKRFLAQDIPVVIQWAPHTVLAVGYDESPSLPEPLVIYHNPAPPSWFLDPSYPGGKPEGFDSALGAYATMPLGQWMSPDFWGNRFSYPPKKYEMIIAMPPETEPSIPWDEVMTRNARKVLGLGEWISYPPYFWSGCEATRQAAKDIEAGVLTLKDLTYMFRTTGWGPANRSHASAFLASLSEVTNSKDLRKASEYFELAAYKWEEVNTLWKYIEDHPREIPKDVYLPRLVEVFYEITDYEEMAGNVLMRGAKVLAIDVEEHEKPEPEDMEEELGEIQNVLEEINKSISSITEASPLRLGWRSIADILEEIARSLSGIGSEVKWGSSFRIVREENWRPQDFNPRPFINLRRGVVD